MEGKRIATVTVGGSLIAGYDATNGTFENNGAIRAADDIGSILIKRSLLGNVDQPCTHYGCAARPIHPALSDMAIGKIVVLGRVEFAEHSWPASICH